ncbi:MAG: hypothetical protein QME94_14455, partial [Anaerolineae bacterium]|nr:hypothetical protein [Anaerolineae bacterium]
MSDELARALRAHRRALARARMRHLTSGLERDPDAMPGELFTLGGERLAPLEHWRPVERGDSALTRKPRPAAKAPAAPKKGQARRPWFDRALLAVEAVAVVGLVVTMGLSFGILQRVGQDAMAMSRRRQAATRTAVATSPVEPTPASAIEAATERPTSSPSP